MPDYETRRIGGVEITRTAEGGWTWKIGPHEFHLTLFGGYLRCGGHIIHEADFSPVRMVPWSQGYCAGRAEVWAEISGRE